MNTNLISTLSNPPSDRLEYLAWLETKCQELRNGLRVGQQSLADWRGGQMAVSAVPGAGKSHSLSVAAALVIARNRLHARRQLVIVTYTRSAAANIKSKIRERLKELMLPPGGFVVHTLHGLALNIANSQKELSGLDLDSATIVSPNHSHRIIRTAVERWIVANSIRYQNLLEGAQFDGEETEKLRRQSVLRTEVLPSLALTVIREAKSSGFLPEDLWEISSLTNDGYEILAVAAGLYEQYQQLMRSQDFIDYDDMILAALRVLDNDAVRAIWQNQIFAVFEDEAQDSSPLQEKLISLLSADPANPLAPNNLVRVGDPNQAINSTFTPADPVYFNWFCQMCDRAENLATMDMAGRSNRIIIAAANFALQWVNQIWEKQFKTAENSDSCRDVLWNVPTSDSPKVSRSDLELPFRPQNILPVDSGDPQANANPEAVGKGLEICTPKDVFHSVELIGKRVVELLKEQPKASAAILIRENRQGKFIAEQLAYLSKEHQIRVYEVSEGERQSQIPEEVYRLLRFVDRPHSPDNLKAALEVLESRGLIPAQDLNALSTSPEQFLYPTPLAPPQKPQVEQARKFCAGLLRARIELPHYQLVSFLGLSLKYTGSELATLQKLADRVDRQISGRSSLKSTLETLDEIVNSEKFEGIEEDNEDLYTRGGQLTIITMHKAKGLDWDYVFIPFLHEDTLPGKPWTPVAAKFLGGFTLAEVARAQIRAAVHAQYKQENIEQAIPEPDRAWDEAGKLKTAEEYRLLYVAMTRAKRLLWMSAEAMGPFRWNLFKGDRSENLQTKQACPILPALQRQFPESVVQ
ncbi:MAG: ATP-dependent helicase [Xenococcaceae cyanobacterium]